MKKFTIILIILFSSNTIAAQEKNITAAMEALSKKNYEEAKSNIDDAIKNTETKDKPKTLYTKVRVYDQLQNQEKYKYSNPYRDETQALLKLAEINPDFEKTATDQYLIRCAFLYFNDGVKSYNDKNFKEASDLMKYTVKIHNLGNGKRFENYPNKLFDTIAAEAKLARGNSAYNLLNYEDAITFLLDAKSNAITKSASVYECLIDAYSKLSDSTNMYATIQEARKIYQEDLNLKNYEMKYYLTFGKREEQIKKLEDAAKKDPTNAELMYNIATTYYNMTDTKNFKKSSNTAEILQKVEDYYKKALKLAPENAEINYNYGVYFFNQANEYNDQLVAIKGNTDENMKKFDELKTKRDNLFTKSVTYLEKAYTIYAAKENLSADNKTSFKSTAYSLWQIYGTQNKTDKSKEMKSKYDSL